MRRTFLLITLTISVLCNAQLAKPVSQKLLQQQKLFNGIWYFYDNSNFYLRIRITVISENKAKIDIVEDLNELGEYTKIKVTYFDGKKLKVIVFSNRGYELNREMSYKKGKFIGYGTVLSKNDPIDDFE